MGTLTNQNPRRSHSYYEKDVDSLVKSILKIAKDNKISYNEALEAYKYLLDERKVNLKIDDFDIKDEQLGGFGILIKEFIDVLERKFNNENED